MSTSLSQALPTALKSLRTRPLFVLRERVLPLLVVGQTPDAIRRGTFRSVRDLIREIHDYIRIDNSNQRPFQWVASASRIIRKVNKYKRTSETAGLRC